MREYVNFVGMPASTCHWIDIVHFVPSTSRKPVHLVIIFKLQYIPEMNFIFEQIFKIYFHEWPTSCWLHLKIFSPSCTLINFITAASFQSRVCLEKVCWNHDFHLIWIQINPFRSLHKVYHLEKWTRHITWKHTVPFRNSLLKWWTMKSLLFSAIVGFIDSMATFDLICFERPSYIYIHNTFYSLNEFQVLFILFNSVKVC